MVHVNSDPGGPRLHSDSHCGTAVRLSFAVLLLAAWASCDSSKPAGRSGPRDAGAGGNVGTGGRTVPAPGGTGGQASDGTGGSGTGGVGGATGGETSVIGGTGGALPIGSGGAQADAASDHTDAGAPQPPDSGPADSLSLDGVGDVRDGAADAGSALPPACSDTSPPVDVRLCVRGADDKLVTASLDSAINVSGVDDVMSSCDVSGSSTAAPAVSLFRRIAVESQSGSKWTVLIQMPELPTEQVRVGETLQMTVTASPVTAFGRTAVNQTVVFSRQGTLVLFASNLEQIATSVLGGTSPGWRLPAAAFDLLPDLTAWGLTLSDGGPVCSSNLINCLFVDHQVNASWGGSMRLVRRETVRIGTLSLSIASFARMLSNGGCDGSSVSRMGGFVAAP